MVRGVANFGEIFEKSEIGVQIFFFTWGFFFSITRGRKNSVLWHFRANPRLWWGIYGKMDRLLVT